MTRRGAPYKTGCSFGGATLFILPNSPEWLAHLYVRGRHASAHHVLRGPDDVTGFLHLIERADPDTVLHCPLNYSTIRAEPASNGALVTLTFDGHDMSVTHTAWRGGIRIRKMLDAAVHESLTQPPGPPLRPLTPLPRPLVRT